MKNLKMVFGIAQFFKQNEPKIAALLGNIAMILSIAAALPLTLSGAGLVVIPTAVITVSTQASVALSLIKAFSKLFGTENKITGESVNVTENHTTF